VLNKTTVSTIRYPLFSQMECEGDGDMHAENLLFPRLHTLFAYNFLSIGPI